MIFSIISFSDLFQSLSHRQLGRKVFASGLMAVMVSGSVIPVFAQTAPESADANSMAAAAAITKNGYAEMLRSRGKKSVASGSSNVVLNRPFQPISKADDQADVMELEMFVGESRVFPTPGVNRIAVGNGSILTAAVLDNKETILFANAAGTSSLFVWNENGSYQRIKINIVPGDTSRFAREIAAFLSTIPNAKASIIGDKVIVEGDNLSDDDLAKIEELGKRYPQIVNFTNKVGWEKMVMMDVKVVEFPKTELRQIGLNWTPQGGATLAGIWAPASRITQPGMALNIPAATGAALPVTNADGTTTGLPLPSALSLLSGVNLGLSATLNLLEQNGKATMLAEPQLSARSGSSASFQAGGEFPYTSSSLLGTTVTFKPYGIILKIKPVVDRNGIIRASIDSDISEIDNSISTSAGPALTKRSLTTEFNVRNGETMVLAGLLSRNTGTNIDKVPFLGDIPILGALFRSKRFQNNETELVVFVTPTIVDSHSPGLVDRVQKTTQRLQDAFGATPYLSNPMQPGRDADKPNLPVAPVASSDQSTHTQSTVSTPSTPAPATAVSVTAIQSAPAKRGGATLHVIVDGLPIYSQPYDHTTPLKILAKGAVVRMTSVGAVTQNDIMWRQVVSGDMTGWVESDGVAVSANKPVLIPFNTSRAAQTDLQGTQLGQVPDAAKVAAAKSVVTANQANSAVPATAVKAVAADTQTRVTLQGLVLRVAPDINALVLKRLAAGTVVTRLPGEVHGNWVAVDADGQTGWLAGQWLVEVGANRADVKKIVAPVISSPAVAVGAVK